ncbi:MAG TPA: ABC transporter permease [Candidatus Synoicihabitans sp.]|nr:ABC transporter permease [Candidatus Synoicihabitans sp.]
MNRRLLTLLLPLATGLVFIALWYAVRGALGPERQFLLPAPHDVLAAFSEYRTSLLTGALNTTKGALLGFGAAVTGSFALALILSLTPLVRASLYPYLMMLQMTPVIVLAPILVLWAGPGLASVTIITFLICFFPMVVNTTQGLISTDRNLVDLFQMCRATRRQEIFLLRVPAALPYFFTGLRIAATLAPIGAIVGDYTAGNAGVDGGGLGFLTIIYSAQFKMGALFATALTGCALGFLFVAAVTALSRLFLHQWHDSVSRTDT